MTKSEYREMRRKIQSELYDWAVEKFGSFDEFKDYAFHDGKIITIPTHLIPPSTYDEWMNAKANESFTDGLIEIHVSVFRGGIEVRDGHNRLKTALNNGVKELKVIFRE